MTADTLPPANGRTQAWLDSLSAPELDIAQRVIEMPGKMAVAYVAVLMARHEASGDTRYSRAIQTATAGVGAGTVVGAVKAAEMLGWL
tara:strand:+ start:32 stop:295 length:264 start_codon:yes stop_codon:yes gene_type:complete